jgi:hypothetical protein
MEDSQFLEAGVTQLVEKLLEISKPEGSLTRSDISAPRVYMKFK